MAYIDLLELFYKKYTNTIQASDYVEWANDYLYLDVPSIKKLSRVSFKKQSNMDEIEKMFTDAMKEMQREIPSREECLQYHLKQLHSQLLIPNKKGISIVKEIYDCVETYNLFEEQKNWEELKAAIDDVQYGGSKFGYTLVSIEKMITTHARKLWHTKTSQKTFHELVGQKVKTIDSETHLMIQLEKGTIIIECPWRIRGTGEILFGETDIQSNPREWISVKELLIGKTIEDIQLFENCPLLVIQCGDIFVDVFHSSSYFDGWTLTGENGFYTFSMHGGHVV